MVREQSRDKREKEGAVELVLFLDAERTGRCEDQPPLEVERGLEMECHSLEGAGEALPPIPIGRGPIEFALPYRGTFNIKVPKTLRHQGAWVDTPVVNHLVHNEYGSRCRLEIGYRPRTAEMAISAWAVHPTHCANQHHHRGQRKHLEALIRIYEGRDLGRPPLRDITTGEFPVIVCDLRSHHYTVEAAPLLHYRLSTARPGLFTVCLQSGACMNLEIWYEACPSTVEGRVTYGSCESIAGHAQLESEDGCLLRTELETDGSFRFDNVWPGDWQVILTHLTWGMDRVRLNPVVLAGLRRIITIDTPGVVTVPIIEVPEVAESEPLIFKVALEDQFGNLLRGVRARVLDPSGRRILCTPVSDDEGNIAFPDPGTGSILLCIDESEQFQRLDLLPLNGG